MSISFAPKGDDPFGFSLELAKRLKEVQGVPLSHLLENNRNKNEEYLQKLSYDPTKAKYYDDFAKKPQGERRLCCFALEKEEEALFQRNGFVVSERLGAASFAEIYYRIYSDDLPVFVTSDSILHAWHKSFDQILENIEKDCLVHVLSAILRGIGAQVEGAAKELKGTFLEQSVLDVDYFAAVGLSLLKGEFIGGRLNQDERVKTTIAKVMEAAVASFDLFGRKRDIDFSLFKPRGHYASTPELQKYFRAMTWCGTIDMRIAGNEQEVSTRELGSACVLYFLLSSSKEHYKMWADFDHFLQKFIGITDSMTFEQLGSVLKESKISTLVDIKVEEQLTALQAKILSLDIGKQDICGHLFLSPAEKNQQIILPRSFTFMGQKFALDSWVTSNVTYDRILDENGNKVQRRIPSALDVAYSVFNNEHVTSELVRMMGDHEGLRFRDGSPYHQNLLALRKVVDSMPDSLWNSSIYYMWLATLRALSVPQPELSASSTIQPDSSSSGSSSKKEGDEKIGAYPQVARTAAWQDRVLNTQLASWTQLRHDTILYVKQSFSGGTLCEYPEGYVDPNVKFWKQFLLMAKNTARIFTEIQLPTFEYEKEIYHGYKHKTNSGEILKRASRFYEGDFVPVLEKLLSISEKQATGQQLTSEPEKSGNMWGYRNSGKVSEMSETRFLKNVIEESHGSGATKYLGWYPNLFFEQRSDSGRWDPLVADVHTDGGDDTVGDPGCVLHQAVGNVHTMLVTVDRGGDVVCYAGPVLSHYEFTCPLNERKSDADWRNILRGGEEPPHPRWTRSFLAPGKNPFVKTFKHKDEGGWEF